MHKLSFFGRACGRLPTLAAVLLITANSAPCWGQDSDTTPPASPAAKSEFDEAVIRNQVLKHIKHHEEQIAIADDEEVKLKAMLEDNKKAPADGGMSAVEINKHIASLGIIKSKHEAEIDNLRAYLDSEKLAERETALARQQNNLRIQKAAIHAMIAEWGARRREKESHDLPPLKNAEIKIFSLAHAAPQDLAKVIESIFSPAQLRLSIDDRTKSLVVMGDKESLAIVESLLMKMDQPADGATDVPLQQGAKRQADGDRSLLLRVFWLADGLPEDEGQDPAAYLPNSVLKALDGLGLKTPRLVAQTVNAVAVTDKGYVDFSANVPAVLLGQTASLNCNGSMRPIVADRAGLDVQISVIGPSINCGLQGSLATPLGHYMVLGTANSLSADPSQMAGMHGGEMGAMPGGFQPGFGVEGGFGGGGADPTAAAPQEAPRPKLNQARFAFVVQVIEATSYPAEK